MFEPSAIRGWWLFFLFLWLKKNDMDKQTRQALRFAQEEINRTLRRLKEGLQQIGEDMCEQAREQGDYNDRTGTTRSAMKYRVVEDGETVADGGYVEIEGTEQKTEDPEELAERALDAIEIPDKGISLLFANGSEYADMLEDKGFNVTYLTEEWAKDEVERLLRDTFGD